MIDWLGYKKSLNHNRFTSRILRNLQELALFCSCAWLHNYILSKANLNLNIAVCRFCTNFERDRKSKVKSKKRQSVKEHISSENGVCHSHCASSAVRFLRLIRRWWAQSWVRFVVTHYNSNCNQIVWNIAKRLLREFEQFNYLASQHLIEWESSCVVKK